MSNNSNEHLSLSILKKFKKNLDGVISVEFALIAPMLIFATLYALNLGYMVNKHQKLASSIAAGNNYLQDYTMHQNLSDFRPVYDSDSGEIRDNTPIANAKNVIQSSFGHDLRLDEIFIDTICACPNNAGSSSNELEDPVLDLTDPETEFYTRTKMAVWKKGEICAFDCPEQGGKARVIVELKVNHTIKDLFSNDELIQEVLKSRMR